MDEEQANDVAMDQGEQGAEVPVEPEGPRVEYRCLQCDRPPFEDYQAAKKHRQRTGHRVGEVDLDTGELVGEIGKRRRGRPVGARTASSGKAGAKAPPPRRESFTITTESGADIAEHAKKFASPPNGTLFIAYDDGRVEKFWDRFPDHQSIYRAIVNAGYFQGTPAEFVDASARFMLASAGYEPVPTIIPRSQRQAYEETARLIEAGYLRVSYDGEGRMHLEPTDGHREKADVRDTDTEGAVQPRPDQHQPPGLRTEEGGEEEPGAPES